MPCPWCGKCLPVLTPRLGVDLRYLSPRVRLWLRHERRTRHLILTRHGSGDCTT